MRKDYKFAICGLLSFVLFYSAIFMMFLGLNHFYKTRNQKESIKQKVTIYFNGHEREFRR